MIKIRTAAHFVFCLGLLAFSAAALHADETGLTKAQKRHIVGKEVEDAAGAKTREELREAMPGHQQGEHTASGHGEVNSNPLEFKKDLALFTAAVFVVLLGVLWKFAWGPISTSLERREQAVQRQIAETAENNEQAKLLLAQYGEKLQEAKEEVRGILDQARRDAEATGRDIVAAAQQDAKSEQQRAVREIGAAKADALQELARRSAAMAVELAGKIVGGELRAADHAKLVEQAVEQFASVDESSQHS